MIDALERELRQAARALPSEPPPDLDTKAAEAASLVDVAYAQHDSPVGTLLLAATPRGLVRISYVDEGGIEHELAHLARTVSPRVLAAPRRLEEARRELDEYFAGARERFELRLDWRLTRGFGRLVLESTARIPYGAVSSYARVAADAGSPRGARAAGNALGANPLPIVVPCHRVLRAGGALGGYTGGIERKLTLLAIEGATDPAGGR